MQLKEKFILAKSLIWYQSVSLLFSQKSPNSRFLFLESLKLLQWRLRQILLRPFHLSKIQCWLKTCRIPCIFTMLKVLELCSCLKFWLVRITMLGLDPWRRLIAKNKFGFVDGTITLSSPLIKTLVVVDAWIRCDNMVGSWLNKAVSPQIRISITYKDIALEIWNDLRDTHSQGNGPRVFSCKRILHQSIKVILRLLPFSLN